MSEADDLSNFNPIRYTLPAVAQATAELVAELLEGQPDALVIDCTGKQIIVYPRGAAGDRPTITVDSLPGLLSTYEITMLPSSQDTIEQLLASHDASTHVALFHHPALKGVEQCQTVPTLSSKILAPHFALLCTQDSPQSEYRLTGAVMGQS